MTSGSWALPQAQLQGMEGVEAGMDALVDGAGNFLGIELCVGLDGIWNLSWWEASLCWSQVGTMVKVWYGKVDKYDKV